MGQDMIWLAIRHRSPFRLMWEAIVKHGLLRKKDFDKSWSRRDIETWVSGKRSIRDLAAAIVDQAYRSQ